MKLGFVLLVCMILSACGGGSDGPPGSSVGQTKSNTVPAPAPEPTPDPTPDPTPNPVPIPGPVPSPLDTNCVDPRGNSSYRAFVEQVCVLVNQVRKENGNLPSLKLTAPLSDVAQAFAQDMVFRGFFDHTNPDGLSPFDRMHNAGIFYSSAGENIAYGYPTPESVMNGWMNSSGHRANILNARFGKLGVGFYQNYWVQDFTN